MSQGGRFIGPIILVDAQSLGASFTSNPFSIQRFSQCMMEILATGTPTGVIKVQGSLDYSPTNNSPAVGPTWFDVDLSLNALTGAPNNYFIDFTETSIPWLRVVYTRASGTGSLDVVATAKES